ncbi:hypothetical protein F5884DRAFT_867961 [Xylogone sp. PMI_703]|nr:hypothetical protein F5884DRAFT_867961 [Xylogone sp. PMI_703]
MAFTLVQQHWYSEFYQKNKGWLLVLLSQFFAVFMHTAAKSLESGSSSVHPLQILALRMVLTFSASSLILWRNCPEAFPFGEKELRSLFIIRGMSGVIGAVGFYCSLIYLPLSEATILNFLAPLGACCMMTFIASGSFTASEVASAILSLVGVMLITQPSLIFGSGRGNESTLNSGSHLVGFGFAMMGAMGGMCAYTSIRTIGKRAHSLTSVNYFAATLLLVSIVAFAAVPGVDFKTDLSTMEWSLLALIATIGFLMEVALTAGLSAEDSHRATYMIYSQAIIALIVDGTLWHKTPGVISLVGCLLISLALAMATLSSATDTKAELELAYLESKFQNRQPSS